MTRNSPFVIFLFSLGQIISPVYSLFMRIRVFFYRIGILKQHQLPALIISVGNLTLGGTGKTPLVQYIAYFLRNKGFRPAVISRGYKGKAQEKINIVSNGDTIFLDAIEAGDEARLLADTLDNVPVLTGKKRVDTGKYAIKNYGVDSLLLDDGFQHLAVKRDIDLVLFNANTLMGNARVLPGGDLREPLSSLTRVDCFVITGVDDTNTDKVEDFIKFLNLHYPEKKLFQGKFRPVKHLRRGTGDKVDNAQIDKIVKLPLTAFCGIGSPETFKHTLELNNFNLQDFKAYGDHYTYSEDDLDHLRQMAAANGSLGLITTQKDFVKLKNYFFPDFPIYSLDIELVLDEEFDAFLTQYIQKKNSRS